MSEFIRIASVGDVPEGRGRTFSVAGRDVAVFLVGGRYYALDDRCPHMGASLGTGDVCQEMVVCDRHMWAFRLADGSCPDAPLLKAETFEVRVVGKEIQVRAPDAEGA